MTGPRREEAMPFLLESLASGDPSAAIERQEARGQAELLNSTVLPSAMHPGVEAFEALGFTFGDPVPGDPLFRDATLPAGWTKRGSDHAMGSYVLDERGVARVSVFYKAAFYDRRADMSLINVGQRAATEAIYGDGAPVELNPALTTEELRDALAGADDYIRSAEDHHGTRLPRATEFRALVVAALGGAA